MTGKPTYEELEQRVKELEKICRGYAKAGAREHKTERKRAEEDRRKSERRCRHLVEGSPDIIWSFSDKRGTLFASYRVEKILGYSPEHLYKNPWLWNLSIHPDDKNDVDKAIEDFAAGKDLDVEYRIKDASGKWLWFRDRSIDRRIEGDEVIIEGISTDLTERKRTEEALRQAENNFRRSLDDSPLGVRIVTMKGETIYANRAILEIYGYDSIDELRTTPVKKHYTPESYSEFQIRKKKRQRGGYCPPEYEISIVKKNGEVRHLQVLRKEIVWNGERQFQVIYRDVTDRKRMEEELKISETLYRELFENCGAAITIVDQNGKYLLFNEMAAKMLGKPPEKIVGKSICDFYQEALGNTRLRANRILIENGGSREYEETFMLPVGERTYRIIDRCIKNVKSHNIAIQSSAIDITDRVMAERERECMQSELFQAQKMESLGTLVAGLAHEINNPINIVMNNAPLLRSVWKDLLPLVEERAEKEPGRRYGGLTCGFLKENLDQLISDIDMAANRVASIVKGLKDYSRKTSPLEKQQVDINIAVENVIRLAGSTIRKPGITLALDLAPNLPSINANLQNLEQVILNLAINAVQAIDHDHGEIKIATTHNKNQGTIVLSVQDNGKGISPAISDKIFDPFFTEWQSKGGTGLGLPITQNLVKANDGEITFKSRMGKGTAFLVSFTVERKKKPFKILLVDDNEAVLEIVKQALTIERHYMVEQASGGNEALIKIGIYHPDLLILDIFMPQMDGVEVCRAIQKHPELHDLKVIILTGYPEHEKVKEVAEMGFTKVIAKPFLLQEFMKKVDGMLRI